VLLHDHPRKLNIVCLPPLVLNLYIWILSLFTEIKFSLLQPPLLLCDNLCATNLSFNPVQHSCMKHIHIDLHFVRDLVQKNSLVVRQVHTNDQLADLLTKPLSRQCIDFLKHKIGLTDGSPFLRGRIKENHTANSCKLLLQNT
jgi:hypothetical protein